MKMMRSNFVAVSLKTLAMLVLLGGVLAQAETGVTNIVTLGRTADGVLAAMLMAEKTAQIWIAAANLGGPNFMTPHHVARISGRPDEAYRRKVLKV